MIVNAAGGLDRTDEDGLPGLAAHWLGQLRLNVLTAVLLTRALLDRLRRPGGRVILLSSIAALRGGGDSYSVAKAALHGWAYSLAGELGPEGITVNVVAPGYVADTEFFAGGMTAERGEPRPPDGRGPPGAARGRRPRRSRSSPRRRHAISRARSSR